MICEQPGIAVQGQIAVGQGLFLCRYQSRPEIPGQAQLTCTHRFGEALPGEMLGNRALALEERE